MKNLYRSLLLTLALASPLPAASQPPPKTVYITTFSAQPDVISVPVGTTVTWKNYDEITHSIVLPDETSQRIWAVGWKGQTFSKTFETPGEYPFHCGVHKDVHGKIIVTSGPVAASPMPAPSYPGHTLSGMPRAATSSSTAHQHQAHSHAAATAAPVRAASPVAAAGNAVLIKNHAFSPAALQVPVGARVTWHNQDTGAHTVVFPDLASERMGTGDSYSHRFDAPGDYDYRCGIHGSMKGRISVGHS